MGKLERYCKFASIVEGKEDKEEDKQKKSDDKKKKLDDRAWKKIRKCIMVIVANYGFFADLLFNLKIKQATDPRITTMATDGLSIMYNSDFANELSEEECVFVLCHEIMHNALFHFDRGLGRDPELWNISGDYAINLLLEGIGKMPEKVLYEEKYKDWSTEQIYAELEPEWEKNKQKKKELIKQLMDGLGSDIQAPGSLSGGIDIYDDGEGEGEGNGQGKGKGKGKGKPGQGGGTAGQSGNKELQGAKGNDEKMKQVWGEIVRDASSKNQGFGSANMQRFLRKISKPKVNWQAELRKFVANIYSKLKHKLPQRRAISRGDYLWGLNKKKSDYNNVVIAIDTSGSISEDDLDKFASEIHAIFKNRGIKKCHVIWCDYDICGVQEFSTRNKFKIDKLRPQGFGGTRFTPPFDWIQDNLVKKGLQPAFMIYFTDALGDCPDRRRYSTFSNRVIWIVSHNDDPSNLTFGKRILIDKM